MLVPAAREGRQGVLAACPRLAAAKLTRCYPGSVRPCARGDAPTTCAPSRATAPCPVRHQRLRVPVSFHAASSAEGLHRVSRPTSSAPPRLPARSNAATLRPAKGLISGVARRVVQRRAPASRPVWRRLFAMARASAALPATRLLTASSESIVLATRAMPQPMPVLKGLDAGDTARAWLWGGLRPASVIRDMSRTVWTARQYPIPARV
jgi:hypothetical protein